MKRALVLAALGRGLVSPNPMVGCVIVKDERIIAEGWHQKYGDHHAEVNAINQIVNKEKLAGAEMYVTLEPCSHFGKTPPCADLIIQYPFKKVYVATKDINPLVAGKGIEKIKQSGIEVELGLKEKEALELNQRFFTSFIKKRPYIILKWAMTSDGFIARKDYSSKWISNELSRKLSHKWRTQEDGVMVGTNTALYDNPSLTSRDWHGKSPTRIVIDKSLRIPSTHHLMNGQIPTLIYNYILEDTKPNLFFIKIPNEESVIDFILQDLFYRKVQSLIIEGGSQLIQNFIEQNLWDEARIFKSPSVFKEGISAPQLSGMPIAQLSLGNDLLDIFTNPNS